MTRVNIVPVEELSDQWLIAEYRELPRVLKGNFSIENSPTTYQLGKGHVKWARKHAIYTDRRMYSIISEMHYRGFKTSFKPDLHKYITNDMKNDYSVNSKDLQINKDRLIEKYSMKPSFYTWTKRVKPSYFK